MLGHLFLWRRYPGLLVDLFHNHSSSPVPIRHSSTSPNLLELVDSTCTPTPVPTWLRTPIRHHLRPPNSEHFSDIPIRTFLVPVTLSLLRTSSYTPNLRFSVFLTLLARFHPIFFTVFFSPPPSRYYLVPLWEGTLHGVFPSRTPFLGGLLISDIPMGPLMNLL